MPDWNVNPIVHQFIEAFRGRDDAYGSAKGFCVNEKLTPAVFERHLYSTDPEDHIGVYCMIDTRCSWGCIDIDGKDFPLDIENKVWDWDAMMTLALNLYTILGARQITAHVEQARNGYHVWVFPEEPLVSAAHMRRALMAACVALGYSPKEVNPKAEGPRPGTRGLGNFVRLPYGGKPLTIEQALERIRHGRTPSHRLESVARLWTPPPPPSTEIDFDAGLEAEPILVLLDGKTFTIWKDGPLPGSDRSNTLARLAYGCAERGITATQAFAVLKSADARWGKFHDRADCDEQLARFIERAYE
jgi:hypothetical protein